MPTYDYKCTECGHVFEEFHMMSENPVQSCPKCLGIVERLIGGGIGVIFRGTGFYVNDSRPTAEKPKSPETAPKAKEAAAPAAAPAGASEAKPEKAS